MSCIKNVLSIEKLFPTVKNLQGHDFKAIYEVSAL